MNHMHSVLEEASRGNQLPGTRDTDSCELHIGGGGGTEPRSTRRAANEPSSSTCFYSDLCIFVSLCKTHLKAKTRAGEMAQLVSKRHANLKICVQYPELKLYIKNKNRNPNTKEQRQSYIVRIPFF